MSFALPEEMREYVDDRVRAGQFGNTSEYLRALIRRDQEEQAAAELRRLIADGISSGEPRPLTNQRVASLRERALGADG